MELQRKSGILMPVFSLPEKYGIGTLGQAAYDFIDMLKEAGQTYWQILPVGSTSFGDSPYQSFSTYAGNPYFVDLTMLVEDGLLTTEEVEAIDWGQGEIDYKFIYDHRFDVLKLAADRGLARKEAAYDTFAWEEASWLQDYALFMALKRRNDMRPWYEWEDEGIRLHKAESCARYLELLKEDVDFFSYIQYLFYRQWQALKDYAGANGIEIIGDIPIYVAMDSADVWAEPHWFLLDPANVPISVAGCPPDSFSADGQLWGNPLYRWDRMKEDGYGWWVRRIGGAFRLYDHLRIDHFRGFESYWSIPYGDKTAMNGHWVKGPGMDLITVLKEAYPDQSFIAEDLGYLTDEVRDLLARSELPGMKILEFAFDSRETSNYLPHTYTRKSVCYTGTHDNVTLAGWIRDAASSDVEDAMEYLDVRDPKDLPWAFIRAGMASVSDVFMVQMQDYLALGADARINRPGTLGGNWTWRMEKGAFTRELRERVRRLTELYERR